MLAFILLNSFWLLCVFCVAEMFLKKLEFVLIASITILLTCAPIKHLFKNLFSTKFSTNFFTALTYFYLCLLISICENLFLSLNIFSFLWESLLISENLFFSVRISSYLWEPVLFCENLWEPFLFCENLWESFLFCENF